jgi:hypothetical protein
VIALIHQLDIQPGICRDSGSFSMIMDKIWSKPPSGSSHAPPVGHPVSGRFSSPSV